MHKIQGQIFDAIVRYNRRKWSFTLIQQGNAGEGAQYTPS